MQEYKFEPKNFALGALAGILIMTFGVLVFRDSSGRYRADIAYPNDGQIPTILLTDTQNGRSVSFTSHDGIIPDFESVWTLQLQKHQEQLQSIELQREQEIKAVREKSLKKNSTTP